VSHGCLTGHSGKKQHKNKATEIQGVSRISLAKATQAQIIVHFSLLQLSPQMGIGQCQAVSQLIIGTGAAMATFHILVIPDHPPAATVGTVAGFSLHAGVRI
jgi:hypothetical protein